MPPAAGSRNISASPRMLTVPMDSIKSSSSASTSGATPSAASLHICRTVCRRAERAAIACGEDCSPEVVRYLNRLSDLLFILSRGANAGDEPLWEPGRYR